MAQGTGQHNVVPGGGAPDEDRLTEHRLIELRVAATVGNLAVLRTLVAAAATFEDLDYDAVSDLRLAVDEACTRLVQAAVPNSTLVVRIDPRDDAFVVHASTTCESPDDAIVTPGSFSWHVLSSLTDEVSTFIDGVDARGGALDGHRAAESRVFGISLTARRTSLLR